MVGVTGFEPTTSSSRTKRSTKLSYTPTAFTRLVIDSYSVRDTVKSASWDMAVR